MNNFLLKYSKILIIPLIFCFILAPVPKSFAFYNNTPLTGVNKPVLASNQFIVKFNPASGLIVQGKVDSTLSVTNTITGLISIDALNSKFGIQSISPIYKELFQAMQVTGKSASVITTANTMKFSQRAQRVPANPVDPLPQNIYLFTTVNGANINQIIQAYNADSNDVAYAEPNYQMKAFTFPQTLPNDSYINPSGDGTTWSEGAWQQNYEDLWSLKNIQANKAWVTSQGKNVVVAVVDTGVDYNHEDLKANILPNSGWNFVGPNPANPMDNNGHGTHCAGIIAAIVNNKVGIAGVAPKSQIMPVKGLDAYGEGYLSDLSEAIIYAADHGADILSLSWGGPGYSQALSDAVQYAYNQGCIIVAAAGNSNADAGNFTPANINHVMAIAAVDHNDVRSTWSNYGSVIDVAAPGGDSGPDPMGRDILSLRAANTDLYGDGFSIVGQKYYRARGTSMACPYVAGLAALILSENPALTNDQVRQVIEDTADHLGTAGRNDYYGYGRINANDAVASISPTKIKKAKIVNDYTVIVGNGDGVIERGDQVKLAFAVKSVGGLQINNVTLSITSTSPFVTISNPSVNLGNIPNAHTNDNQNNPFLISIANNAPFGQVINFNITLAWDNTYSIVEPYNMRVERVHILQGWPQKISTKFMQLNAGYRAGYDPYTGTPLPLPSVTVADMDGNGYKDIFAGDYFNDDPAPLTSQLYAWDYTGNLLPNWPVRIKEKQENNPQFDRYIAIGSNAGAANQAIYTFYDGQADDGILYAFNKKGNVYNGFPISLVQNSYLSSGGAGFSYGPYLLNNNGNQEILYAMDQWYPQAGVIANVDLNGQYLPGWPVTQKEVNYDIHVFTAPLTIGDLYGNGQQEVIAGGDLGNLYMLKNNGVITSLANTNYFVLFTVMGDIDNNGKEEIVAASSGNDSTGNPVNYIDIFDAAGNNLSHWNAPASLFSLSLASIDNSGKLDILASAYDGNVYAWHKDGSLVKGWPVNTGSYSASTPVVGDILRSGKVQVVMPTFDKKLYAWNGDGTVVPGFPITMNDQSTASVSLGDINQDGNIDIVVSACDSKVYVYSVIPNDNPIPANQVKMPWPMIRHDAQNTGNYNNK